MNDNCQVFTPKKIVQEILDLAGYKENLFGQKILENSCGDGNFLTEIIERYIQDCNKKDFSREQIAQGLSQDIYGIEIDLQHKNNCVSNLNKIIRDYDISGVEWRIYRADSLKKQFDVKFNYIVGNPPYVKYSNLDKDTRTFITNTFSTCDLGKPDYYYAFIEQAINLLDRYGKLAYLIPNNVFKNQFGAKLRDYIKDSLKIVHDYTSKKLFADRLTSSAIILYEKDRTFKSLVYFDIVKNKKINIPKKNLEKKWIFEQAKKKSNQKSYRFGDLFQVSNSVATLYNKAFILSNYSENDNYLEVKNYQIEKGILRIAASPKAMAYSRKEYIIFPYNYLANNELVRYAEENLAKQFPGAFNYLALFRDKLDERNADKSANWYEFGRTQALAHLNQEKLLLSILVTNYVKVYELTQNAIPYAGIYIVPKGQNSLKLAKLILESQEFYEYTQKIGIHSSGETIRISSRDINDYEFNL